MSINCSNLLDSLRRVDWETVQKTIGNNHSTIIGVFASWFIHAFNDTGIVIEGAPSFSTSRSRPFKSDALFCEGDTVVGILEVEGSRHKHTIKKIGKHFQSTSPILNSLSFAIYVAYPELPFGRGEDRSFPSPLSKDECQMFGDLSRVYPKKCIVVVALEKLFERERSQVRKKTEYYSGRINNGSARLYQNGQTTEPIQLFGAGV